MRDLLPYISWLSCVGLDEASIRFVFGEISGKDGRSGRDATVGSFSVAKFSHTLVVVGVEHSVIILVVGICIWSGGW